MLFSILGPEAMHWWAHEVGLAEAGSASHAGAGYLVACTALLAVPALALSPTMIAAARRRRAAAVAAM